MRNVFVGILVAALAAVAWAGRAKPVKYLKVVRFKPRHASMLVPVKTSIVVWFSRPVDPATVSPATAQLRKLSGEQLAVTYAFARGGRTLLLTPAAPLEGSTDYQVSVLPGLAAKNGIALRSERHANFFTQSVPSQFALLRPEQFATLDSTMIEGRAAHSAVLLWNGRVLLAAGMSDYTTYAAAGDVFDPATKQFSAAGQLTASRAFAPGVKIDPGAMLLGGSDASGALATTEIYDAGLHQFQAGPRMREQRDFVAAVALRDGSVLVVGGLSYTPSGGALYSLTAELYDPSTGSFRFTKGAPIAPRAGHTVTLLPDGRVFIVGGQSGGTSSPVIAEIYDGATETFTRTASAPLFQRSGHTATVLDSAGDVLLADGGSSQFEFYDVVADAFHFAGNSSAVNRYGAAATLLPDGTVLIAGGLQDNGDGSTFILDGMDMWRPQGGDYGAVLRTGVVFADPRYGHSATTLLDGRVLYAGGFGPNAPQSLNSAVLFTPAPPKSK